MLWLKSVYYRLPLYLRPFLYFFYRYVLRLGFLDGKTGFVFHFLRAFWFRLMVDVRLEELAASKITPPRPTLASAVPRSSEPTATHLPC